MNQRSQVDSAVLFAVADCGRKGVGVLALEKLKANTFIGEYVGEVVGGAELQRRRQLLVHDAFEKRNIAGEERCVIFTVQAVSAGDELTIDYCLVVVRIEKRNIVGEERCGIFTVQAVSAGDELTIDYCFDCSNHAVSITCLCGSVCCREVIGARRDKRQYGGGGGSSSRLLTSTKR
ncbi:hypothetical protein L917_03967 [Phytophthora nicotianae]|uniref:SET domain-containing protein n=1 Tax=Phytophthora nicotianae TaxID=4792 RepID=W2LR87_PHYNI|nr:hypothetical protein L917_03967 [Phytophthora nicotianae]